LLKYGFTAIYIKVYKGDTNVVGNSAGKPAELVLAEELEAPVGL